MQQLGAHRLNLQKGTEAQDANSGQGGGAGRGRGGGSRGGSRNWGGARADFAVSEAGGVAGGVAQGRGGGSARDGAGRHPVPE
ncbi:hypothetical protein CBL_05193 [Carabus blaptoides fortunei]